MKYIRVVQAFLVMLLFAAASICSAQNHRKVTGMVVDSLSRKSVEYATVTLVMASDSSMVSYTVTDSKGAFSLYNVKDNQPLNLLVSRVGYTPLRIPLHFTKDNELNLGSLVLTQKTLAEVKIKGVIVPVIIKADTLEFNAAAFKVKPNAVVQDLLKKLPGMQVDRDGTITLNGKTISQVKVNGRNFFANNITMVIQNLDADLVDKVQVYDDREDDPMHLQPDYKVKKIINLKFKKQFRKSDFGKIGAGGGTRQRYQANGLYNKSVDKFQASLIANANNLSGTEAMDARPLSGQGAPLSKSATGGININDDIGTKAKINLAYDFRRNQQQNLSLSNRSQFLDSTTLTTNGSSLYYNTNTDHSVYGQVDWTPDKETTINYKPQLGFNSTNSTSATAGSNFSNITTLLSKSTNNNSSISSGLSYRHFLNYNKLLKPKGTRLTVSNDVQINKNQSKSISSNYLVSYSANLNSDSIDNLTNNRFKTISVNTNAILSLPVSKAITTSVAFIHNFTENNNTDARFQLNPLTGLYTIFLAQQSNDLTRREWSESILPSIIFKQKSININASIKAKNWRVTNQFNADSLPLNQHYFYLFPKLSLSWGNVNLEYSEDVRLPSITLLTPITVIVSPLYSYTGNPNLKPSRSHNYSLGYNSFNLQSNVSMGINGNVEVSSNSIIQKVFLTDQGKQSSMPVNGGSKLNVSVNGNIRKTFRPVGKWNLSTNLSVNAMLMHSPFVINNITGTQDNYLMRVTEQLKINYGDIIQFEPGFNINPTITKYRAVEYPGVSYVQGNVNLPLDVQWPKMMNWGINYMFSYNSLVSPGFQTQSNLLNFYVARSIQKKGKGELKLSCYDALNQSNSAIRIVSGNTVTDMQSQVIKRYFMLSYSYRFNNVK